MKKTILILAFLVSAITFTSCSSDDSEAPKPTKDKLIGEWSYYKEFENGVEAELDVCDLKDNLSYNADGTMTAEYYESASKSDCSKIATSGTWKNLGNNKYEIIEDGKTNTRVITFEGDTFSFEEKEGDDLYKSVYKRK